MRGICRYFVVLSAVSSFLSSDSNAFASPSSVVNFMEQAGARNRRIALPDKRTKSIRAQSSVVVLRANAKSEAGGAPFRPTSLEKIGKFADKNFFLVGLFFAVTIAKVFPSIGVDGGLLRPELFVGKYGVGLIFLLSGLSLQTSELAKAVSNMKLNGLIQLCIFAAWPILVGLPLKAFLTTVTPNLIPAALVDGLLIMTCLPTTVNMCIMLTGSVSTSKRNEFPHGAIIWLTTSSSPSVGWECSNVYLQCCSEQPFGNLCYTSTSLSILRCGDSPEICQHGAETLQQGSPPCR